MGKRTCVSCAILTLVAAALSIPSYSATQVDSDRSTRIKTLMTERREVLAERVAALEAGHRMGLDNMETVIQARDELISAELELAATRERRIELLKSRVENFKLAEKRMSDRQQVADGSVADTLLATSNRLLAEIELEHALVSD